MVILTGTYYDGQLKLDRLLETKKPVKVKVILGEEERKGLKLSGFFLLKHKSY